MPVLFNSGFLAAAFIEGFAAFILLVLYWLLAPGFPTRFFRYWLAGWTMYVGLGAVRIVSLWRGGPANSPAVSVLSLAVAALFFAAALECTGQRGRMKHVWPLGVIAAGGFVALGVVAKQPIAAEWAESLVESSLYLGAGWAFWRSQLRHRGFGWKLLGGALLLAGLHGLDRPDWAFQTLGLLRMSFQGLLGIAIGIDMAVLVLEAGRARADDLNEKLRRLALITAETSESLTVHDAIERVLHHLAESLNASHGLVYLLDEGGNAGSLTICASVGFGERFLKQHAQVSAREPWVIEALRQKAPIASSRSEGDPIIRRWMDVEKLQAILRVAIPGKENPIGLLMIGSASARTFENEEEQFLANVGNLLGLAVQNITLVENGATSRRQWLDTFNSIDDLIVVHTHEGRILRANRSLAWHLGVDPDLIEGQLLGDLLKQGSVRWVNCPYCEGAAGKAEETDPTFGGHFLVTNSKFHDSAGNPLGTIHVLKDFTERRLAENKFRSLFEKVQEGIFISTPEGRFIDFNDAFLRIVGYENRGHLSQIDIAPTLYVNPADRERLKRLLLEYGEVTDFEFQFRRRDGEIRTAHESSFVTRDDSNAIVAYQGFVLDVTDRKQAEMEIRRRNRELMALNAIAETLSQSAALDEVLARAILKIAELFSADLGAVYLLDEPHRTLKRVAAVGHRSEFARNVPPIEVPAILLEQIRLARATLLPGSSLVLPEAFREMQRQEGVQISQIAVLWAKDRIIGALVISCREMREFSSAELNLLAAVGNQIAATIDKSVLLEETREAYQSLRLAQEQLLQSEKMAAVGQLISGVAHELNNPLTAILGYTQLLRSEESANPRGADYLEKLYKQAQRTHRIVENLLSFARQQKPERTSVQINQILEDTLILREYDVKANRIRIHREFDPQLPLISADFHQLQQVFLNILNNAVDAVSEKGDAGEIWIRTGTEGNRLRVEFTDNGAGVRDSHRVFDPFYTTKPVGKGTGLGLSICYGIVKEHGGEIEVRNSPPLGATFTILVPFSRVAAIPPAERTPKRPAEPAGKILLIDDEEAVLQFERDALTARGMSVRLARSAREGIEILKHESVDAVVTDVKMPGEVSTVRLYRWIEQNQAELAGRVTFTVSPGCETELKGTLRKSSCQFLRKPFEEVRLWEAVQKMLSVEAPTPTRR
jgi:PAS domain S-box-containing protein